MMGWTMDKSVAERQRKVGEEWEERDEERKRGEEAREQSMMAAAARQSEPAPRGVLSQRT